MHGVPVPMAQCTLALELRGSGVQQPGRLGLRAVPADIERRHFSIPDATSQMESRT